MGKQFMNVLGINKIYSLLMYGILQNPIQITDEKTSRQLYEQHNCVA